MIHLYTWATPNGHKISIALEEMGLPYTVYSVNIGKDEQFASDFLRIAPNNKIPAIIDDDALGDPLSVFESGAILLYLAEKTGKFLAQSGPERYRALEWLSWQISGIGPTLGQLGFFAVRPPEKIPLAIDRFTSESARLLNVMDNRLSETPFLAGANYSIADIACYTWIFAAKSFFKDVLGEQFANKTALNDWVERVGARPAVVRGMSVPKT